MSLSKKEKQWLRRRSAWYEKLDAYCNRPFGPTCRTCSSYKHTEDHRPYCKEDEDAWVYDYPAHCWLISTKELIIEAAQFEAFVAAKLANPFFPEMDKGSDGPYLHMPPMDRLKWARIEVEEEIDAD